LRGWHLKVIESSKSYWDEFLEKDFDQTEFKSIVAEDTILSKITDFAFKPWSISECIHEYPFGFKVSELQAIDEKEEDYLFDKRLYQTGDTREWFDFLCKRYLLVKHTILIKYRLDELNKKSVEKVSEKRIREFVKWVFDAQLSKDFTITFKKTDGIQRIERAIGIYYPVRLIKDIVIVKEEQIVNNESGKHEKSKTKKHLRQEFYLSKPTGEDIERAFNELDVFSAECFQKHGRIMPNITYGGFHPDLDGSSYHKEILGFIPSEYEQFLIEFYYIDPKEKDKAKKIKSLTYHGKNGKEYTQFVFPIRKRYLGLLKKVVKDALKLSGEKLSEKEDVQSEAEEIFLKALHTYDKFRDTRPASWIESYFRHFPENIYKVKSTESIKVLKGKSKRRLKTDIEREAGSLDDILFEDTKTICRGDLTEDTTFEGKTFSIDKLLNDITKKEIISQLNPKQQKLYRNYYFDELTQEALAQKHGVSQTTIHREIKNLEKKISKII